MRIVALCALSLTAACGGVALYGQADRYARFVDYAIDVEMPPNALFISQQFRKGSETGTDAHPGMDVWGPLRTPVLAAADGAVIASYYEPVYGNRVVIDHGRASDGLYRETVYMHLKERLIEEGARVQRGQPIGLMGATGAMGMMVHLHFEVHEGPAPQHAKPRDPNLYWLNGVGKVTCFVPGSKVPTDPFRLTYPVQCR
ncbi:M23 family metallopeptidase [Aestuariivita sp.]|uniref:M23 family metallopeptidase n=1 Tax=Aestuariivita sp. TaxID=1872407 RepID=UPI00216F5674|nr:M23 family metallopeptidase [Aestuariivita sp.]MCE8008609.1 M23 family metallopeptidase [Aestuariivita sp.]